LDAVTLLRDDHRMVKRLLRKLEGTTTQAVKTRRELLDRLEVELRIHETIEEELFYPALKSHPKARDIVLEGYEEHDVVNSILKDMDGVSVADERWAAKASVMTENLEHHIEEEETDMFVKARQVFDRGELHELGERMVARKAEARKSQTRNAGARSHRGTPPKRA
jgi:hemerythrin-like domain-containing protein